MLLYPGPAQPYYRQRVFQGSCRRHASAAETVRAAGLGSLVGGMLYLWQKNKVKPEKHVRIRLTALPLGWKSTPSLFSASASRVRQGPTTNTHNSARMNRSLLCSVQPDV